MRQYVSQGIRLGWSHLHDGFLSNNLLDELVLLMELCLEGLTLHLIQSNVLS